MSTGWFRIWIVVSVLMISGSIFYSIRNANENFGVGSSWYCVPGTYEERIEKIESGFYEPTEAEVESEYRRLRGDDDPMLRELQSAMADLEQAKHQIDPSSSTSPNTTPNRNGMEDLALRHLAKNNLSRPIIKDQNYFSCTTYWAIFRSILLAVIFSLTLIAIFRVIKWIINGFQGKK